MNSSVFSINDIITIVMSMLEDIYNKDRFGIENDDLDIPVNINEKIELLDEKDCEDLFCLLNEIVKKVYNIKNGELHELNLIHKEIIESINYNLARFINNKERR